MAQTREVQESRDKVVERFLTRRSWGSLDGSVYTDGSTLCVRRYHVAFWHQGIIYIIPLESSEALVKDVQTTIRLGSHGHRVAETGENDNEV